jgi:hypothetical protein
VHACGSNSTNPHAVSMLIVRAWALLLQSPGSPWLAVLGGAQMFPSSSECLCHCLGLPSPTIHDVVHHDVELMPGDGEGVLCVKGV